MLKNILGHVYHLFFQILSVFKKLESMPVKLSLSGTSQRIANVEAAFI